MGFTRRLIVWVSDLLVTFLLQRTMIAALLAEASMAWSAVVRFWSI